MITIILGCEKGRVGEEYDKKNIGIKVEVLKNENIPFLEIESNDNMMNIVKTDNTTRENVDLVITCDDDITLILNNEILTNRRISIPIKGIDSKKKIATYIISAQAKDGRETKYEIIVKYDTLISDKLRGKIFVNKTYRIVKYPSDKWLKSHKYTKEEFINFIKDNIDAGGLKYRFFSPDRIDVYYEDPKNKISNQVIDSNNGVWKNSEANIYSNKFTFKTLNGEDQIEVRLNSYDDTLLLIEDKQNKDRLENIYIVYKYFYEEKGS
ncbi:hypothetical protein JBKA6_0045 [Ichthyobacterium seriolicida]|uniref:Uncharacterized protein n=2 Tax=Ichthyobacterium seriolicida TaxID=242600 RepID=A0A1J1DW26_9FLAO|nr:hypothetical protein JBKA6_0045 [Ichthyobacterium seriolicida]